MTSSNKDPYCTTVDISLRSSPGDSQSYHGLLFQTGQGGRPVLPPLADSHQTSRFPVPVGYYNAYTQPRSAPNKIGYELNPEVLYGGGPDQAASASPQFPAGFPNYEPHDCYSPQPSPTCPLRTSTHNMVSPADQRLPPLATTSTPPIERWPQHSFVPHQQTTNFYGDSIQLPTASHPPAYAAYTGQSHNNGHPYHMQPPHIHLSSMSHQGHDPIYNDSARLDPRSTAPDSWSIMVNCQHDAFGACNLSVPVTT